MTVLLDVSDAVATITLNRPERLNALNHEVFEELGGICNRVAADDAVRAVLLTGAGRAFCAGGDVKAMAEGAEVTFDDSVKRLRRFQHETSLLLHTMPKPTIAAVNGYAMGAGMSLALACDLRIMAEGAQLGTAFVGVALSGDFGGSWFLTRLIGPARTRELYMLGGRIDAAQALEWGVANRVVPGDELMDVATELASRLSKGPTRTLALMKRNLNLAQHSTLEELLDQEALHQRMSGSTEDHREAARAFVEKREPNFAGR